MKTFVVTAIFVVFLSMTLNIDAQKKSKDGNKNRAPSRSLFEEMFGKPVDCYPPSATCYNKSGERINCAPEGTICFQNERKQIIQVMFNASNYARTINVFDGGNSLRAVQAAEEIIMINGRGRTVKKASEAERVPGCNYSFTDDYEFLSMRYYGNGCVALMPGGVEVTWKK